MADVLFCRAFSTKLGIRAQTGRRDRSELGGVTASNLSKAEESWEAYRNAWVEFARLRYPSEAAFNQRQKSLRTDTVCLRPSGSRRPPPWYQRAAR